MCRFTTQLAQPALGYLMDHIVAGHCLLPGAAMFEAAAAAGACLEDATSLDLCLAGVAIPAPLVMQPGKLQALSGIVDASQGAVQLQEDSLMSPGDSRDILIDQPLCAHLIRLWVVVGHFGRNL